MLKWKCHKAKLWKLCETAIEIVNEKKNRVKNFESKKKKIYFFHNLVDFMIFLTKSIFRLLRAEKFSSFEACSKCKNQNKKLVIWLLVVTQFLKRHMSFFRPRYLLGPNSSLSPPKKRFKNSSLFRSHISLIDLDLGAKLLHLVWKECTYIFPKISNVAFLEKMWKVKEKIFLYSSGVLMPIQKYIFTNVFHFVVKYLTYLLT